MDISLLLMPAQATGCIFIALLFLFCFLGVHILRLVGLGYSEIKPKAPPQKTEPQEKKPPAPSKEPIYYIVERKKRPPKSSYGEPKKISFK